jgi:hypothetical protein
MCAPRPREDGRGDDACKVVREVVRRVEAAVLGAVALVLPAGGTAGKEAQAPGAAAAYAAKRASTIRGTTWLRLLHNKRRRIRPRGRGRGPRLSCGQRGEGSRRGRGPGRRQAAGAAATRIARCSHSSVFFQRRPGALRARTDLWPELGRSGPERRGHLGLTDTATGQTFVRKSPKFVSEV